MIERKKYKLAGHKRIITPIGEKKHKQSSYSGGWSIECSCGWKHDAPTRIRIEAEDLYSEHIKESMPICHECGEIKAERDMSKSNRVLCKKCVTERAKEWGRSNKSRWERQKRKSHLKKKYDLSIEEYDKIIESQCGVCAICKGSLYDSRGYRPHVDHDHKTGKVRGVLCTSCNNSLGKFKDNKMHLLRAYRYLLNNEMK